MHQRSIIIAVLCSMAMLFFACASAPVHAVRASSPVVAEKTAQKGAEQVHEKAVASTGVPKTAALKKTVAEQPAVDAEKVVAEKTTVETVAGEKTAAEKAADMALALVGMPYRYRGEGPERFDCSGLVRFSYLAAGVDLPHGTKALKKRTVPVLTKDMQRGDLLFFVQRGRRFSHVGIFTGDRRFVHATNKRSFVREDSLDDPYYKKHFLGARRIS